MIHGLRRSSEEPNLPVTHSLKETLSHRIRVTRSWGFTQTSLAPGFKSLFLALHFVVGHVVLIPGSVEEKRVLKETRDFLGDMA